MTLDERAREVAARFGFYAPSMAMRKAMLAFAAEERERAAKVAENHSWQEGKLVENACCAATGCDIAYFIRNMEQGQ